MSAITVLPGELPRKARSAAKLGEIIGDAGLDLVLSFRLVRPPMLLDHGEDEGAEELTVAAKGCSSRP